MSAIKHTLALFLLTLVEHILESLCGKATELALGQHLAFMPKSKVTVGWQVVNSGIVCEPPHLTDWERQDGLGPVVTVYAEHLTLYSKVSKTFSVYSRVCCKIVLRHIGFQLLLIKEFLQPGQSFATLEFFKYFI